jgi:hypothetical protein
VWNPIGKDSNNADPYLNWLDPVSMFDRSAVKSVKGTAFELSSLTHDYSNIAKDFTSSTQIPVSSTNPNGTTNLMG